MARVRSLLPGAPLPLRPRRGLPPRRPPPGSRLLAAGSPLGRGLLCPVPRGPRDGRRGPGPGRRLAPAGALRSRVRGRLARPALDPAGRLVAGSGVTGRHGPLGRRRCGRAQRRRPGWSGHQPPGLGDLAARGRRQRRGRRPPTAGATLLGRFSPETAQQHRPDRERSQGTRKRHAREARSTRPAQARRPGRHTTSAVDRSSRS